MTDAAAGTGTGGTSGGAGSGGSSAGGNGTSGAGGGSEPFCEPGTLTPMAKGESFVLTVTVDAEHLYWGTWNGDVLREPLAGGAPTLIATGQTPIGLGVDSDRVYWFNGSQNTVVAQGKAGGEPVVLAKGQLHAEQMRLDEQAVYWGGYTQGGTGVIGALARVDKDGSGSTTLAAQEGIVTSLAVDDQAVYFTAFAPENAAFRVDKQGGKVTTLLSASAEGLQTVSGIAVRNGIVYIGVITNDSTGQIWSTPAAGGAHTVLVDQIGNPFDLAVDATHIYWSGSSASAMGAYGTVGRVPLGGGPPEILVAASFSHVGLTLDEHALYFGRIWDTPPEDGVTVLRWCKTP